RPPCTRERPRYTRHRGLIMLASCLVSATSASMPRATSAVIVATAVAGACDVVGSGMAFRSSGEDELARRYAPSAAESPDPWPPIVKARERRAIEAPREGPEYLDEGRTNRERRSSCLSVCEVRLTGPQTGHVGPDSLAPPEL